MNIATYLPPRIISHMRVHYDHDNDRRKKMSGDWKGVSLP
jgi:hypothetical protein